MNHSDNNDIRNSLSDDERLEQIAQTLDARRYRLDFVRSNLFFVAGSLALCTLAAQFTLERLIGAGWLWYLLWLPAAIVGYTLLIIRKQRYRTITLTDRSLLNVWMFAIGISGYMAIHIQGRLPIAGFLTTGMAIAVAFSSELFRRNDHNKSNQSGSLVVLQMASMVGAFLAAWIFHAALDDQPLMQFLFTAAAIIVLLFGTGAVLRHNEHRDRV